MKSTFASVLTLVLLTVGSQASQAQLVHQQASRGKAIFTHTSVEQAWKSAVATKKPLLVMFTSDSCLYCKKMMKETYQHPAIARMLSQSTETVMAHSRDYRDLVQKLGVRGYPSTLLISPEGNVLDFMEGYVEPKAFADRIYPLLLKRTAQVSNADSSIAVNTAERQ